jgi:arylsulfatase A-like enzyme
MVVLDTVRADNLSVFGYKRPTTPSIERLADGGALFEWAFSTAPWTTPSHASMFTGHFPHEMSVDWQSPLDETYPTVAQTLTAQGYLTGGFVANVEYCGYETGLNRGFLHYEDYSVSLEEALLSSSLTRNIANSHITRQIAGYHKILGSKTAADVNHAFVQWLSRQDRQHPFFAFLNYLDAHEPYLAPAPFDAKFTAQSSLRIPSIRYWMHEATRPEKVRLSPPELQGEIDAYDGAITYIDEQLGSLLDTLGKRGDLDNTLVIVVADHGEEFGEHGAFTHGNNLYRQVLHVPLLLWYPSRIPKGKFEEPVSLRDLPATVADILNLKHPTQFTGTSLTRYWDGKAGNYDTRTPVLSELSSNGTSMPWKGAVESLVIEGKHYIKNGDGREELYDLGKDSFEKENLATSREGQLAIERFRNALKTIVTGANGSS